jgi:mRNA interferase RelE/StbE
MPYAVEIRDSAAKALAIISKKQGRQIAARIDGLGDNPRPRGSEKVQGAEDLYRIRSGNCRIIYQVMDARLVVLVIPIGHRREVYR